MIQTIKEIFTLPYPEEGTNKPHKGLSSQDYKVVLITKSIFRKISHIFKLLFSSKYRLHCKTSVIRKEAVLKIETAFKLHLFRKTIQDKIKKRKKEAQKKVDTLALQKKNATALAKANAEKKAKAKEEAAAITIQRFAKGFLVRRKVHEFRQEQVKLNQSKEELSLTKKKHKQFQKILAKTSSKSGKIENNLREAKENLEVSLKLMEILEERKSLLDTYFALLQKRTAARQKTTASNRFLSFFSHQQSREYNETLQLLNQIEQQLSQHEAGILEFIKSNELNIVNTTDALIAINKQVEKTNQSQETKHKECQKLEKKHRYATEAKAKAKANLDRLAAEKNKAKNKLQQKEQTVKEVSQSLLAFSKQPVKTPPPQKKDDPPEPPPTPSPLKIKSKIVKPSPPPLPSPDKLMLTAIGSTIHKDMRSIFDRLVKKLPPSFVQSWTCSKTGEFSLKLKNQVKLWLPSAADTRVKGGVIMKLGDEKGFITGKLDSIQKTIIFHSGYQNMCNAKVGFWTKQMTPTMRRMTYTDKGDIAFVVKPAGLIPETTSINKLVDILREWGDESELVTIDPWKFLETKN